MAWLESPIVPRVVDPIPPFVTHPLVTEVGPEVVAALRQELRGNPLHIDDGGNLEYFSDADLARAWLAGLTRSALLNTAKQESS